MLPLLSLTEPNKAGLMALRSVFTERPPMFWFQSLTRHMKSPASPPSVNPPPQLDDSYMVVQWSELLLLSEKVAGLPPGLGGLRVEFSCGLCAHVGFLQVLWFHHADQKRAC